MPRRPLFILEKTNGYYRPSAYFLATVTGDLLPLRILPIMIFGIITWAMLGLPFTLTKLAIYWLFLFLLTVTAVSICYLISALVPVFFICNLAVAVVYTLFLVFSGLLVNLNTLPGWLVWIKYISFM